MATWQVTKVSADSYLLKNKSLNACSDVVVSDGHDEFMRLTCPHNGTTIPSGNTVPFFGSLSSWSRGTRVVVTWIEGGVRNSAVVAIS